MKRLLPALTATTLALGLIAARAQQPPPANPLTNGGFEELDAAGFPRDWEPVGNEVAASPDAHTGQYSLRITRGKDAGPETGLNRAWKALSGQQGAQLSQVKGGVAFWYKATESDGAKLVFYVIPMSDKPLEDTGNPRQAYEIPSAHVGDGQWHQGRLKYDFSADPKVKWVQISPRITGGPGEMLLDDIRWVEQIGPWLSLGDVRLVESERQPGRDCTVEVKVQNSGDALAETVRVGLEAPAGLRVEGSSLAALGRLAPDASAEASFRVTGVRDGSGAIRLRANAADGEEVGALLRFAPKLGTPVIETERFILALGEQTHVRATVKNEGAALIRNLRGSVRLPEALKPVGSTVQEVAELPPGVEQTLEWSVRAVSESPQAEVLVTMGADNTAGAQVATEMVVAGEQGAKGMAAVAKAPAGVELRFPQSSAPMGVGELWIKQGARWQLVAKMPRLARLVYRDGSGQVHDVPLGITSTATDQQLLPGAASLLSSHTGADGAKWQLTADFQPAPAQAAVDFIYQLTASKDVELLCFEGPMLYVGEGSFGSEKTEAVFPGMEWLVSGEVSSSMLDDHTPNHMRYVPHPNKVTVPAMGVQRGPVFVGLAWDPYHKWDGQHDRMSAVFASPDRFEGHASQLMGLFVPSVPEWAPENERLASKPYPLKAGQTLTIKGTIVTSASAKGPLVALEEWLGRRQRLPEPMPLPHAKALPGEVAWNVESYLSPNILWVPEEKQWWTSKGAGPLLSPKGRPTSFVQDLLLASQVIESPDLAASCRQRAELVLGEMGGAGGDTDLAFLVGRPDDALVGYAGAVGGLLAGQRDDGSWRFFANRIGTGVFEGLDYRKLGPHDAAEVGTCARNAYEVLRLACMTGDARAAEGGRKALEFMQRFTVPRAAQVWEVPVHTPDILAAADAVDAYLEGYRLTRDERWLAEAVAWGWRGLPFVYVWNAPEFPFMRYASIPVFGASWYEGSWIGRPVQWNGLRYAFALLKLSEYDKSLDWAKIAQGITVSAMYQQATEGENKGLWPDSIGALAGDKAGWVFAPYQINHCVYKLLGREVEPQTVALGSGPVKIRVNTVAKVTAAKLDGEDLTASLEFPAGQASYVLVASIAEPKQVLLNGAPLKATSDFAGNQPAYRYQRASRLLTVRVAHTGRDTLKVTGARPAQSELLPSVARRLAFEFEAGSTDGFGPQNDVQIVGSSDGLLRLRMTGPDPYLVRPFVQVEGDTVRAVLVRMAVKAGQQAQFYWTTAASPAFAEDKVVQFTVQPDGQMHTYRLEVGSHALWKGQRIAAVRLDPTSGQEAVGTEVLVDYVRGAP